MFADEKELRQAIERIEIEAAPRSGHQTDLRRRVLLAFDEAGAVGVPPRKRRVLRLGRNLMHNRRVQMGAATVAAACILGVVLWSFGAGADVALAEVRALIEQANTICYELSSYRDGRCEETAEVMFMEPGKMRVEWPGMTAVFDWNGGKILTLMTEEKVAHSTVVKDMMNPYQRNWLADLKAIMDSAAAEELGRREFDGRQAKGWRMPERGWLCTVWADAKSGELLQAEFEHGGNRMVMSRFVLNQELDESLFSMDPPEGYTLAAKMEMSKDDPSEEDVLALLRVWASGNAGRFPDRLDPSKFAAAAAKADWRELGVDSREKAQALREAIGRAFYLLHNWELEWGYVGKGVDRGQADRPVLWYRRMGSKMYRVAYGDFSVADVTPEQLERLKQDIASDP